MNYYNPYLFSLPALQTLDLATLQSTMPLNHSYTQYPLQYSLNDKRQANNILNDFYLETPSIEKKRRLDFSSEEEMRLAAMINANNQFLGNPILNQQNSLAAAFQPYQQGPEMYGSNNILELLALKQIEENAQNLNNFLNYSRTFLSNLAPQDNLNNLTDNGFEMCPPVQYPGQLQQSIYDNFNSSPNAYNGAELSMPSQNDEHRLKPQNKLQRKPVNPVKFITIDDDNNNNPSTCHTTPHAHQSTPNFDLNLANQLLTAKTLSIPGSHISNENICDSNSNNENNGQKEIFINKHAKLPLFDLSLRSTNANKRRRIVKPVWLPTSSEFEKFKDLYSQIEKAVGMEISNEAKVLETLKSFDMNINTALDNIRRNKAYYKNYFRVHKLEKDRREK